MREARCESRRLSRLLRNTPTSRRSYPAPPRSESIDTSSLPPTYLYQSLMEQELLESEYDLDPEVRDEIAYGSRVRGAE